MRIVRWDPRSDGPFSERALRQKIEPQRVDVVSRRLPAGAVLVGQPEERERLFALVSGLVKVACREEAVIVAEGDVALISAGLPWRVEVLGGAAVTYLEGFTDPAAFR